MKGKKSQVGLGELDKCSARSVMVTQAPSKLIYVMPAGRDQPRPRLMFMFGVQAVHEYHPEVISIRPTTARQSSACSKTRYPSRVMRKIPSPDHVAQTTAIGSVFRAKVKQ